MTPVPASTSASRTARRWLPLVVLQVVELVVAFVLVDTAVHVVRGGGFLVGAAAVLVVLALTARGPLGVLRLVPPAVHVRAVTLAAVVLALSPVVPALRPDIEGIIVVEVAAVGLLRVATLTRTVPGRAGVPGPGGAPWPGRTVDATVVEARPTATPDTGAAAPTGAAPPTTPAPRSGAGWARSLGRAAGVTGARYGPEVKARTKDSIRQAGRAAGRLRAAVGDGADGSGPEAPDRTA